MINKMSGKLEFVVDNPKESKPEHNKLKFVGHSIKGKSRKW